jgi:hypothetical protein
MAKCKKCGTESGLMDLCAQCDLSDTIKESSKEPEHPCADCVDYKSKTFCDACMDFEYYCKQEN